MVIKIKKSSGRIVIKVIILFFILPSITFSQCKENFKAKHSFVNEGITSGIDYYYQNLIIQDLALAAHQSFHEISIRFDYEINFKMDICHPEQIEISVLPPKVECYPLLYLGFDIASSVKPEKADLVFHLIQKDGFVSDSLIFFNIDLDRDSSFYTSLFVENPGDDPVILISFSRAIFYYSKLSYERFRNRILQIDDYYAAAAIADSAIAWTRTGFLSENGNRNEIRLRQLELQRIINYIRPEKFESVLLTAQNDPAGLTAGYYELIRLNNRFKAILDNDHFDTRAGNGFVSENDLCESYLNIFDHYYQFAFETDFRYVNFIEGLARPDFSDASLDALQLILEQITGKPGYTSHEWGHFLAQSVIDRGNSFEIEGNQLRALNYYEAAFKLSKLLKLPGIQTNASDLICRMMAGISGSYIEISRKSALVENPALAAQYFYDALGLYPEINGMCAEPPLFDEYETWLFSHFENQVVKCIELNKYNKALSYLDEIRSHCLSSPSYLCPDQFHAWMGTIRAGIYHDLLEKAQYLVAKDELPDAEQLFMQASAMRLKGGYRIEKDVIESKLEVSFRQQHYDVLIDEGKRFFLQDEFTSALFFFNKADFLERLSLVQVEPQLFEFRQASARQIIYKSLQDGRFKSLSGDYEGAKNILTQVNGMLSDYQFAENDSLLAQCRDLEKFVTNNECLSVSAIFDDLVERSDLARSNSEFILAYQLINEAVEISLEHLYCRINDGEAWYRKVMLESPADFERMEMELDELVDRSYSEYLKSYQDLKKYYSRNKLLGQGVSFIPLYDRLVLAKDSAFLTGMLNHYIMQRDFDHSQKLMERMRELGLPAGPLADEQRAVAEYMARRDAGNPSITEPWKTLESYTGREGWYWTFNWRYKFTWLEAKQWEIKYWPFLWKKIFFTL